MSPRYTEQNEEHDSCPLSFLFVETLFPTGKKFKKLKNMKKKNNPKIQTATFKMMELKEPCDIDRMTEQTGDTITI